MSGAGPGQGQEPRTESESPLRMTGTKVPEPLPAASPRAQELQWEAECGDRTESKQEVT